MRHQYREKGKDSQCWFIMVETIPCLQMQVTFCRILVKCVRSMIPMVLSQWCGRSCGGPWVERIYHRRRCRHDCHLLFRRWLQFLIVAPNIPTMIQGRRRHGTILLRQNLSTSFPMNLEGIKSCHGMTCR
jgi:hypothetical protein